MTGILRRNDYAFVEKHTIVDEIRTAIQDSGEPVEYIAHAAGVSRATIDSWLHGRTKKPYSTSLEAVARALGKRLTLSDNGDMQLVDIPHPPPAIKSRRLSLGWRRYQ